MMESIIDILIPAVNNSYFTCSLINSIKINTKIPYKIIYIDNGSDIREFKRVMNELAGLNHVIIKNNKNLGFVKAINQGLSLSKSEYVCLQNNDTLIFKDYLERMIKNLNSVENSGIISPISSRGGGKQGIEIIQSSWDWFEKETQSIDINNYSHEEINNFLYEQFNGKTLELDRNIAFFSVVMHRNTLQRVGCLDERYGLGLYDDDDYCQRIVAQKLKLLLALDIYVWHLASTTFKTMYSDENIMKMLMENRKIFEDKWN